MIVVNNKNKDSKSEIDQYESRLTALGKTLSNEEDAIEEYFKALYSKTADELEDLKKKQPALFRIPIQEEMFVIDLDKREITIPQAFKTAGIGVQGDTHAEIIYFIVDRYFDTADLANENIQIAIEYINSNGEKNYSPAIFIDSTTEKNKIIFGWDITDEITKKYGTISFAVSFYSISTSEDNKTELVYRLNTKPITVSINKSLHSDAVRSGNVTVTMLSTNKNRRDGIENLLISRFKKTDKSS